jgi:hypothetical protein
MTTVVVMLGMTMTGWWLAPFLGLLFSLPFFSLK